ncbi:histidine kinase dimerization/phosphoacceptor domain -containing protein [Gracilimonas sp.]|uniref:histidine kinase dimerization/phosphoacceptor domain -containing protein n=1 Tax=Gracilimonas sp. TaxID=1974203 RepID=UPI002871F56B|nr:histidine kinase dimerization/phosphoacceptor domain -containing protein [Gracilimonas sp.]
MIRGSLWYGTNAGLHFFDAETLEETEPGVIEGLFYPLQDFGAGIEFNFLSTLKEDEETLWFGSYTHGLIEYSGTKPMPKKPSQPFLRGLLVYGDNVENPNKGEFKFSHDRHHVMLEIGAYNYEDPQRVFYEYRLNGSQEDWRRVYNKTEINYTHLPPGDYSFEVRTKSMQSLWGDPVRLASFTIEKPYWNTAWFYGLMLFLAIGILFTAVKVYLVYYEKKKLNRLVEERTNALKQALSEKDILIKEIHHRVKNNMAVISGLLDLQAWKMPEGEARNAIENSKLRLQTMSSIHEKLYQHDNLTDIDFKSFTEDLVQKVSQTLKGKNQGIEVNLDIESGKLDVHTAIPCGLIVNEALCNCFEHAFTDRKEGKIDVVFKNVKSNYHLKIADNGIGIPKELMNGKAASLGITLMRSLASQIKAEVHFDNVNGTTLSFVIPKKPEGINKPT